MAQTFSYLKTGKWEMNFEFTNLAMYSVQITGLLCSLIKIKFTFHVINPILCALNIAICVESNDVTFIQNVFVNKIELFSPIPFS